MSSRVAGSDAQRIEELEREVKQFRLAWQECISLREKLEAAESALRVKDELIETTRARWQGCQGQLTHLERLVQELAGENTDTETNIRTIHRRHVAAEAAFRAEREKVAELRAGELGLRRCIEMLKGDAANAEQERDSLRAELEAGNVKALALDKFTDYVRGRNDLLEQFAAEKQAREAAEARAASLAEQIKTWEWAVGVKDKHTAVCAEIQAIMRVYREQAASRNGVDTPGGLEHMGDVWRLLGKWDAAIAAARAEPVTGGPAAGGGRRKQVSRSGDDYNRWLYRKFTVVRTDGKSAPGQKHERCRYFVLDLDHDQFAAAALATYRDQCGEKFPVLADDIGRLLRGENVFGDWRPEGER